MVRSSLAGTKTQTRRLVKLPRWAQECNEDHQFELDGDPLRPYAISKKTGCLAEIESPYGERGDMIWCRETWAWPGEEQVIYRADPGAAKLVEDWRNDPNFPQIKWRPSIFMQRQHSRLTLRISEVRVQRLHEISEQDAQAEGVSEAALSARSLERFDRMKPWPELYRPMYSLLWDEINGDGSWSENPLVWALTFEVLQKNVDEVLANG